MVEREVIDVLLATVSTFILFIIIGAESGSILFTSLVVVHVLIIFLNFFHLILRQLNRISDEYSIYLVGVNFVMILIAFTLFLVVNPVVINGFWTEIFSDDPELGYRIITYLSYGIMGILVYISRNAELLVPAFLDQENTE